MSKLTDFPVYSAKTKKRVKYGILGSGLIVIMVMAALLTRPPLLEPQLSKISVSMEAQVIRDGFIVDSRVNDDDLILKNFVEWTQTLLYWPNGAQRNIVMLEMEYGDAWYYIIWNDTATQSTADSSQGDTEPFGYMGDDNSAPTRTDYEMNGDVFGEIELSSFQLLADSFTFTFIHTNDAGSWNWVEAGISIGFYSEEAGYICEVLFCHDTFSAIAVVANDIMILNYRFTFGTGYTENFLETLCYIFLGADQDEIVTIDLTDTGGSSRSVKLYTDTGSDDDFLGHVDDTYFGGWMRISDSASGIPSRSAYQLMGSSVSQQCTVAYTGAPDYDVLTHTVFVPSSAITVRAASYERYTAYVGGGAAYFMMFALSHTPVYVAASMPVRAEFTLEM